jgi:exopolyphosphatase/pppGpp-phosphohydrolase
MKVALIGSKKGVDGVVQEIRKESEPACEAPAEQEDPRLGGVLRLARVCKCEQGHARQVTRLALEIFKQLRSLHKMGEAEGFWLHAGSLLHDIGWIEGRKAHHKTALRMILESPLPPLGGRERRIIGCIARYHRRANPRKKHEPYGSLRRRDRKAVRALSAILRVADALDVMHENRVGDITCRILPEKVTIDCAVQSELAEERKQALRKGRLFEKVFDRKLDIQWHPA